MFAQNAVNDHDRPCKTLKLTQPGCLQWDVIAINKYIGYLEKYNTRLSSKFCL